MIGGGVAIVRWRLLRHRRGLMPEIVLGMAGPLVERRGELAVLERTHATAPERLTGGDDDGVRRQGAVLRRLRRR